MVLRWLCSCLSCRQLSLQPGTALSQKLQVGICGCCGSPLVSQVRLGCCKLLAKHRRMHRASPGSSSVAACPLPRWIVTLNKSKLKTIKFGALVSWILLTVCSHRGSGKMGPCSA